MEHSILSRFHMTGPRWGKARCHRNFLFYVLESKKWVSAKECNAWDGM